MPRRVLVVDDEDAVRRLIRRILQHAGYEVVEAQDAAVALALAAELPLPPDLLVTDVMMPGMTGIELAERLRASYRGLPVVYVSGHVPGGELGRAEGTGFVAKPFVADDLLAVTGRLLAASPRP